MVLPQATDKAAGLSAEELRNGVRQYYAKLRAIEVGYEMTTETIAVMPNDRPVIPRTISHFAFRGEKRFKSQGAPSAPGAGAKMEETDVWALDGGGVQRGYRPPDEAGEVRGKDPYIDDDAYMQALAIPLTDMERSLVGKSDWFLPSALDQATFEWKVRAKLETVEGVECHVLENKYRQGIWIDPAIGFAARFRETYQFLKDRPVSEQPLFERHLFSDYRQVADGVWLPQRIEICQYIPTIAPQDRWNRESFRNVLKVTKLAVGDQVADSLFTFSFPRGTSVIDIIHNKIYRVGNANQELDVQELDVTVAQGREQISGSLSRSRWWLILVSVVAIVVVAVILLYRRAAERRRAAH
jgi:hypothetical protein